MEGLRHVNISVLRQKILHMHIFEIKRNPHARSVAEKNPCSESFQTFRVFLVQDDRKCIIKKKNVFFKICS